METNPESVINRTNKSIEFQFEELVLDFRYDNTTLVIYPSRYKSFNHIYHEYKDEQDNPRYRILFDVEDFMVDLRKELYPTTEMPYPNEYIEAAFFEAEKNYFEQELASFQEEAE